MLRILYVNINIYSHVYYVTVTTLCDVESDDFLLLIKTFKAITPTFYIYP